MDKSRLVARVIRQAGAAAAIAAAATAVLVVPAGASTGTARTADPGPEIVCQRVAGPDDGMIRGFACRPNPREEEEGVIVRDSRRSFFCEVVRPVNVRDLVGEGCTQIN
ncbi:hypothetical protein AB0I60_01445 [Actinosynnema sp. NPDC050436]|uniref:hypothetical protein n=1 Tax=Actinosynnema sp. NPDC050436 TaxID=3155659 RepID=UPI0033C66F4B